MKLLRNRILTVAALGLGVFFASAIPAAAQGGMYKGSFTLPVAAEWQGAKLPAGHYTFSINSLGFPVQVRIEGEDGAKYVGAISTSKKDAGEQSFLRLEQRGSTEFVQELYLAQIGLHIRYYVPKQSGEDRLAKGLNKTDRVTVIVASK